MSAKGSQLQTRLYVNDHPEELTAAIVQAFPSLGSRVQIAWRAPLRAMKYEEPKDAAFLRALDLESHAESLANFWPRGGPVWDGLGIATLDTGSGVILVEAKSYPGELYGSGCKAKDEKSIAKIDAALEATQEWLGLPRDAMRWKGSLYQSANRYAHLYWLRERAGVAAWLVHLLFVDDRTHIGATRDQWTTALPLVESQLGLTGRQVPSASHVFLPALLPDDWGDDALRRRPSGCL